MRSLENTSIDKFAQKLARTKVGRVILPALMITGGAASACSSPTQEVKQVVSISTPTSDSARATVTPFPIGAEIARDKENIPGEATATVIAATKPTIIPTAAPTTEPTVEVKKAVNCGILSPEACAKAEYITWEVPDGTTKVKMEGIGISLEPGEKFKITETMQVAATERTINGQSAGYRVSAIRKDGSQINISGDITPLDLNRTGKELPAETAIAESAGLGVTVLGKYTQVIQFSKKEELTKVFPEQTKKAPKFVENPAGSQSQSANQQGGGVIIFGVKPPQSN